LAISATEIFKKNPDCFDEETKSLLSGGDHPLELHEIKYTQTTEESKAINEDPRSGIIISASGMCDSGRVQHHLKHHLWRSESHIVFIGYQAEGTVGRRIIDGAKTIKLFGEEIAVRAHVHTLGGFSAHADQKGLLEWLSQFKNPNLRVFVNHGEEKVSMVLSEIIHQKLKLEAAVPQWREKRFLFTPEKGAIPEEKREAIESLEERFSSLLKNLDRGYKKLRRKLKKRRLKRGDHRDAEWLKELEEVSKKLEELEGRLQ
jgi:metallo-beta-lactamase family protein